MSDPIPAVFDSGVFRPLAPVDLAEGTPADVIPHLQMTSTLLAWPQDYFEKTSGALANEQFERPPQGILLQRDSW